MPCASGHQAPALAPSVTPSSRLEGSCPPSNYMEKAGQGGDIQSTSLRPGEGRDALLPFNGAGMWGRCQTPSLESGL